MISLPVAEARSKLQQLMNAAAESHEPILIIGKRSNAVLVPEEDWRGMQETLHLSAVPGMSQSIRVGLAEALSKSSSSPGW